MLFSEVIGNSELKERLVNSVAQNRVSHAQLFIGPEGCGNLPMALAYAQYLNCEQPGIEDSCGQCASCLKASKYVHPDIHFTFPFIFNEKEKRMICSDWLVEWREFLEKNPYGDYNSWIRSIGKENKQGNINAKECGDILHRLSFTTYESAHKILILWLPEFLVKEGNRLLKLIEEPPEKTIFLFVGHNPDRILNTILSRMQALRFNRLSDNEVVQGLVKSDGLTPESAANIAVLSNGNLGRARDLINVSSSNHTAELYHWLVLCAKPSVTELMRWGDDFSKLGREEQKVFLFYSIHVFREILLMLNGAASLNRLTEEELNLASRLSKKLSTEGITEILSTLDQYIYYVERNASGKILATSLCIEMMHLFRNQASRKKLAFFKEMYV
jgi:DNA polymerase-3 subunit delta'